MWTFYHHHKDVNKFLSSGASALNRGSYLRILAIGSLDIIFTLPSGILFIVFSARQTKGQPFYLGWEYTHYLWDPYLVSYAEWHGDIWHCVTVYYDLVLYPILSIGVFLIFGFTAEARAKYRRWFWAAARPFGLIPTMRSVQGSISEIMFNSFRREQSTR